MYNEFFALRENPFNVTPDPRFLFLNRQTQHALDELTHRIKSRKGLLLLTGEVGTGKTTLLNHLLAWLQQQRTPAAFIFNSHLEVSDLFDFVLLDFAVKFEVGAKNNALMRLRQWLLESFRAGQTPVMIVDEAQGLADHLLEEIRMLLNMETCSEKLLQIVLAGQPELDDRLQQRALRQVKQRVALRCKTGPLSRHETHQYIQTRLHIAGANGEPIFASQAMDAAYYYSRGIPRITNLLCEHALVNASLEKIQPVPAHFVAAVARHFHFDGIKPLHCSRALTTAPPAQRPAEISAHSRFMNALVALSASPKPPAPPQAPEPSLASEASEVLVPPAVPEIVEQKCSAASPTNAPRWSMSSANAFTPLPLPLTPTSHRAIVSRENSAAAIPLAAPIRWTQLWLTTSNWLRQPCDLTQWRLQATRPFHELLRFNHRKM